MQDREALMIRTHQIGRRLPSQKSSMHSAAVAGFRPACGLLWLWISLSRLLPLQACNSDGGSRAERTAALSTPAPRARPANAEARLHLDRGNRLFRVREFDQAIEAYKAGILLEEAPLFHFNLGQAYRMAGQYEKALWHYELFAKHVPAEDPDRSTIDEIMAQTKAQRQSTAAQPPAPTPPAEAKIAASTAAAAAPPASLPAPSAARTRNSSSSSPLRRPPPQGSQSPPQGSQGTSGELAIMVTPWAAVWLNGKPIPNGTPYRTKLPAGKHRLRIANEDLGRQENLIITIKPDETATIERKW
jgi:hypothetical protein